MEGGSKFVPGLAYADDLARTHTGTWPTRKIFGSPATGSRHFATATLGALQRRTVPIAGFDHLLSPMRASPPELSMADVYTPHKRRPTARLAFANTRLMTRGSIRPGTCSFWI